MNTLSENKQLDLYSLVRDVVRNVWVVILAALIGSMAVSVWGRAVYVPTYTSSATLIVNFKDSSSFSYSTLSSSAEISRIFTNVLVQPTMKEYAAGHLGRESFSGTISSSALTDTNIFTVSVTSTSPELSYEELCAVLEVYPQISGTVFSDCIIDVIRSPGLPAGPSNSASQKNSGLAAVGCAVIVLGLIIFFSYMRDTVKNEKFFKEEIDSKLFGTVCHERRYKTLLAYVKNLFKKKSEAPLVGTAHTSFAFSEEYHKIASRIEYLNRREGAKVFLVTSCAEDEGKSTVSANIALTLSLRKKRVVLLDMDFKKPALQKVFEIPSEDKPDLADFLAGKVGADEFSFTRYKNTSLDLGLNRNAHFNYVDWIHSEHTANVIKALRDSERYDFIISDTPPISVAADITALSGLADQTLLVVRTDCVDVGEVNDVVLSLKENSRHFAGCILNDVHKEFSSLTQFALNESGYYGHHNGYYGKYSGKMYPGASDHSGTKTEK
ncbi:MAG: P-loop NTPase [Clostridia bacterium]|nr:P-loop NTPase [Clostridia bacterium]